MAQVSAMALSIGSDSAALAFSSGLEIEELEEPSITIGLVELVPGTGGRPTPPLSGAFASCEAHAAAAAAASAAKAAAAGS